MSAAAEPIDSRRAIGDFLPDAMLATVMFASLVIAAHLAVVLWLSWTRGSPGDPNLVYTTENFVTVFSDQRTYSVLIDTVAFALASLLVALAFGVPSAWIAERTDFPAKTLLFTLMAVGLLIPGFAAAMGWLFLLHPRIGLLNHLVTRLYFEDEPANSSDPVLQCVPAERRATLLARRKPAGAVVVYRFDIVLQGANETAFFNL